MQANYEKYPKVGGNGKHNFRAGNSKAENRVRRPNVAVLGAGFGGLSAARTLAKGPMDVTLIDKHNYHTFFPLLYQVGAAELEPEDITQPLRKIFWKRPNMHFHLGAVQDSDLAAHVVRISGHEIRYDYLVVALGSRPNYYGIPGAAEYAFTLKSLAQGMALRNQILASFERAACEPDPGRRQAWLSFTIVGGGPTGVEFAGALTELIHGSLDQDFPDLDLRQVRVTLLEAAEHLLDNLPEGLSRYACVRLQRMRVDVRLEAQVVRVTPDEVLLKDGGRIAARTVIWTAGVLGNIRGNQWGPATNRHGQVEVLPTLQVPGHPEIYVAGDLAGVEQDGRPLPMVAQKGIQTGTTAGRNILRQLAGKHPLPFRYHDKGTLDVIGRYSAVAYIWRRGFRGFAAWLIWVGVHIANLIGFRNRLLVLVDWAWDYLFGEHGVRLIVSPERSNQEALTAKDVSELARPSGSPPDHDPLSGISELPGSM